MSSRRREKFKVSDCSSIFNVLLLKTNHYYIFKIMKEKKLKEDLWSDNRDFSN